MSSVNSLKVDSSRGRSTRDLSFDHVGTIDFNVVKPFGLFELVPGDHINISPEVWLRTQAMNVPTFGKMDVITRAFFVPLRLTWRHFNDFYRDAPVNAGQAHILDYFAEVPHCKMHDLSFKFLDRFKTTTDESEFWDYVGKIENLDGIAQRLSFGLEIQSSSTTSDPPMFDFTRNVAASTFFYRFNAIGKRVYDLFVSLGYRFQFFSGNLETEFNKGTDANMYEVSILPVLGWLKMFKDWYCPSEFKYLFSDNLLDVRPNVDSYFLDILFDELCWAVFIYFNDDIFSMCEQAPYRKGNSVSPNGNMITQIDADPNSLLGTNNLLTWHTNSVVTDKIVGGRINDFDSVASGTNQIFRTNSKNQFLSADPSDSSKTLYASTGSSFNDLSSSLNRSVSGWSVMAVMKTAEWLQRNNLLSGRVTEYLKAKFGVTPTAARLDIAEYIGHAGSPVKISDIAGTSDDNLASLGAKGTSYSIDKLSYTAEEFGYLYFTVELRPRIGYGQGVDPTVLRIQRTEFYQSEFDALGFEPVPTEVLASGPLRYNHLSFQFQTVNNGKNDNRIFGYLPRMWSYKCKHDNLSGDFMVPQQSYNGDLQSYHLMRTIDGAKLDDFIHNSISFRYAGFSVLDNLFNRIFKNDNSELGVNFDHFMMIVSFDASVNGLPFAMNESWQVNADHNQREGHLTTIQGSL